MTDKDFFGDKLLVHTVVNEPTVIVVGMLRFVACKLEEIDEQE